MVVEIILWTLCAVFVVAWLLRDRIVCCYVGLKRRWILSAKSLRKWRSADGFIAHYHKIQPAIAELAQLSEMRKGNREYAIFYREVMPLYFFVLTFKAKQTTDFYVRVLAKNSDPDDAEIRFADGSIFPIEITLAAYTQEKDAEIDNALQNSLKVIEGEVLKAIERKLKKTAGRWLIVSFPMMSYLAGAEEEKAFENCFSSHPDKAKWIAHFGRMFLVGESSPRNYFFEIV